MENKSYTSKDPNILTDLFAGAISASISKTMQAPVDRVKLILQLQAASTQISKDKQFKGLFNTFKRIYEEQGFFSFWRGNLANILRFFPTQVWAYTAYSLLAGGAAGVTSAVATYPLDFARTRLATDVGGKGTGIKRQYSGMIDVLSRTAREEGLRGIYRGFGVACFSIFLWRALYMGGYDAMKNLLQGKSTEELNVFRKYIAAQSATTCGGLIIYPFDTTRRRMMMQAGRKDVLYRNTLHCVTKIFHEEGLRGFYKGISANLLRGFGGATLLVVYDELSAQLRQGL